jgi:hypothetical protein
MTMSVYEDELCRRLMTGKLQETAMWFLEVCRLDKLEWKDLSPFEVRFAKYIHENFEKWRKSRTLN